LQGGGNAGRPEWRAAWAWCALVRVRLGVGLGVRVGLGLTLTLTPALTLILTRCAAPLSYFHAEYFTDHELFPTRRMQMY